MPADGTDYCKYTVKEEKYTIFQEVSHFIVSKTEEQTLADTVNQSVDVLNPS
jgi:hypothetical protein